MSSKIKDARIAIGMSRAEMHRVFEIPIRTLEDWDSGKRNPPVWAEKLILEKLERMSEQTKSESQPSVICRLKSLSEELQQSHTKTQNKSHDNYSR